MELTSVGCHIVLGCHRLGGSGVLRSYCRCSKIGSTRREIKKRSIHGWIIKSCGDEIGLDFKLEWGIAEIDAMKIA